MEQLTENNMDYFRHVFLESIEFTESSSPILHSPTSLSTKFHDSVRNIETFLQRPQPQEIPVQRSVGKKWTDVEEWNLYCTRTLGPKKKWVRPAKWIPTRDVGQIRSKNQRIEMMMQRTCNDAEQLRSAVFAELGRHFTEALLRALTELGYGAPRDPWLPAVENRFLECTAELAPEHIPRVARSLEGVLTNGVQRCTHSNMPPPAACDVDELTRRLIGTDVTNLGSELPRCALDDPPTAWSFRDILFVVAFWTKVILIPNVPLFAALEFASEFVGRPHVEVASTLKAAAAPRGVSPAPFGSSRNEPE
eukprot:gnl/Chilomastix_cuspidata/3159.p1 GENE.gnl/Chilomastix_cuspidata/3159~~gnl/Chilomastix_cuspidata/3159.p1  ORF type:complete len:307 (+),score=97.58 gnl/Chilomastix_cuspidata/3159:94-1014(+)